MPRVAILSECRKMGRDHVSSYSFATRASDQAHLVVCPANIVVQIPQLLAAGAV